MKRRAILTPLDLSAATPTGERTFEKQVLPIGTINYKGRVLEFSREYLTDLVRAFKHGAYDQVPVVFADGENRHNLDPQRFGGEVIDFSMKSDGLYAKVRASKKTARVLSDNPRLGVSARIVEGLDKADGRTFPRAIQHVLLTMDPRVTGMHPWQTVDLSGYNGAAIQVVDLTALTIEKEQHMPKIKGTRGVKAPAKTQAKPDKNGILDLSSLSDEDLDILLSAVAEVAPPKSKKKKSEPVVEDLDIEDDDESDDEDEDLDEDEAEDDDEPDDDEPDEDEADDEPDEDEGLNAAASALTAEAERRKKAKIDKIKKAKAGRADLSSRQRRSKTIDLATGVIESGNRETISQMRIDLAEERWTSQRREYVRAGVPPFLLDLAAPLLSSPDAAVVDLSNGDEPVNATEIVRDVLDGVKGLIDLQPEIGHQINLSDEDGSVAKRDEALLSEWDKQFGPR